MLGIKFRAGEILFYFIAFMGRIKLMTAACTCFPLLSRVYINFSEKSKSRFKSQKTTATFSSSTKIKINGGKSYNVVYKMKITSGIS